MSSASYIPLTQVSSSDSLYKPQSDHPVSSYVSRKRVLILILSLPAVLSLFYLFARPHSDPDDPDLDSSPDPALLSSLLDTYAPNYIPVQVPDALPPLAHPKLRPVRDLPTDCLESYYSLGHPCHDRRGHVPIDFLWTWVNGSDPLFVYTRSDAANAFPPDDPQRPIESSNAARMFRDHDELRHSIRSVISNFRPYTDHIHILTSDMDYPQNADPSSHSPYPSDYPGDWRLGLEPQWLNTSQDAWKDGNISLSLTHHAHLFEPYNHSSFNSYGIEAQLPHMQNISEVFVYMNDDLFMASPLTPVTFYTHQYGLVLRIQNSMHVGPDMPGPQEKGEWQTMSISNYLLSKRFGARHRSYIEHQSKAIHFPILQELALFWPDMLAKTASHAFRERVGGDGDFYLMFAFPHFLVERSREALLWAWTVGRIGALDDSWGRPEAERAWLEVGGQSEGNRSREVEWDAGVRDTLKRDRVTQYLTDSGIDGHFRTHYQFSSMDGYAYNQFGKRAGDWPNFDEDSDPNASESNERKKRRCTIKRDECFGVQGWYGRASEMFKQIAFDKPQCGDCIIVALTRASGREGLAAFLPPPDRLSPASNERPTEDGDEIPHLPVVADWHDGQFALSDAMRFAPNTSVREWSMRVMQRYRYVIGRTPTRFTQMIEFNQTRNLLNGIDHSPELGLICINDDVVKDHELVDNYFREWQGNKWPIPAAWEADIDVPDAGSDAEDDEDEDDEPTAAAAADSDGIPPAMAL